MTQNVSSVLGGVPGVCATTGSFAFFWLYNRLIVDPLRLFWLLSWWRNFPAEEICSKLTSVPAAWWSALPDRMDECRVLLDREFLSWEATVLISLYFSLLVVAATWLLMRCCIVNPLVRALERR